MFAIKKKNLIFPLDFYARRPKTKSIMSAVGFSSRKEFIFVMGIYHNVTSWTVLDSVNNNWFDKRVK